MKAGNYLTAMRLIDSQDFLLRNAALSEPASCSDTEIL